MSNASIVEHKANMFYVEFREDYLTICLQCTYRKPVKGKEKSKASPYCKALILAIAESWTNEKRGKGTELSFYMTYPQWCESMYGMFGRNVVIDSVDELIGEGLLSREPIKYKGKDTFRYTLNHAEINRRMKDLPERSPYKDSGPQVNALISKRDDKSTGLQVNGKAFTNQPDTRLQVNDDPFTKGRNIESTNTPNIDSAQNTEGTLPAHDRADSGATAPTAPSSQSDSTSHSTEDELNGQSHTDMASHAGALPARSSTHSQLASAANSAAGENHHHHSGRAYSSQQSNGRDERANQRLAPETARDGAGQQEATPPVATSERVAPAESAGYTQDDETQKRPAVRPAQLSTNAASFPLGGKVSHAHKAPARPAQSGRGKGSGKQQEYKVFWTTEGALFRGWYEELTGVQLDETAANARACNALASRASVTYDNLKLVVNEIRNNAWVKRERVGVTVQDLASDDKNLRWEKWLTAAQMAAQSTTDEQAKRSAGAAAPTVSGLPRWTPPAYVN